LKIINLILIKLRDYKLNLKYIKIYKNFKFKFKTFKFKFKTFKFKLIKKDKVIFKNIKERLKLNL